MSPEEVLATLTALGVSLWPDGENLRYRPVDRVSPVLLEDLRRHKQALHELLARRVLVNPGAGGIGDALQGLLAIGGLARQRPGQRIAYAIHPDAIPFVELFDGGYSELVGHVHDGNRDQVPTNSPLQLNGGYAHECRTRAARPRWRRYCDNIGVAESVLPTLREPERLRALGRDFAGCVLLSPFSTWSNREYHIQGWRTVLRDLRTAGYRPVVLDSRADRAGQLDCEGLIGATAEVVAGVMLNAACFIGNDSGMAHLSAILGRDTIVLLGQTTGHAVFGCYPHMHMLQGRLACTGCWWQSPYEGAKCDPCCAALQTILPADILAAVDRVCLPGHAAGKACVPAERLAVIRDEVLRTARDCREGGAVLAELGVWRGGTARLLAHYAPGVPLHLFDTFAGMPFDDEHSFGRHRKGDFADCGGINEVRATVDCPDAVYHAGTFPDTAARLEGLRFRFVHLDGDLYQTTRAGVEFFWPRLAPGGSIVLDDFGWQDCPGVAAAVRDALGAETLERLERPTLHQAVLRRPC